MQAGLCISCSQTPEDRFSCIEAHISERVFSCNVASLSYLDWCIFGVSISVVFFLCFEYYFLILMSRLDLNCVTFIRFLQAKVTNCNVANV